MTVSSCTIQGPGGACSSSQFSIVSAGTAVGSDGRLFFAFETTCNGVLEYTVARWDVTADSVRFRNTFPLAPNVDFRDRSSTVFPTYECYMQGLAVEAGSGGRLLASLYASGGSSKPTCDARMYVIDEKTGHATEVQSNLRLPQDAPSFGAGLLATDPTASTFYAYRGTFSGSNDLLMRISGDPTGTLSVDSVALNLQFVLNNFHVNTLRWDPTRNQLLISDPNTGPTTAYLVTLPTPASPLHDVHVLEIPYDACVNLTVPSGGGFLYDGMLAVQETVFDSQGNYEGFFLQFFDDTTGHPGPRTYGLYPGWLNNPTVVAAIM